MCTTAQNKFSLKKKISFILGRPPPRISWYSGDTLVDASDGDSDIPTVRENELYLPLTRDNAAALSCRASNTNLAPPIVATLEIELYCKYLNTCTCLFLVYFIYFFLRRPVIIQLMIIISFQDLFHEIFKITVCPIQDYEVCTEANQQFSYL